MTDLALIHPGRTDFDDQSRIQGGLGLPLTEAGRQEVAQLGVRLQELNLETILTGPQEPARTTARLLGELLGIPVKECPGLSNLRQGLWEGLEIDEARRKFGHVYRQWEEDPESVCPPQGESTEDAIERIEKSLQKPLRKLQRMGVVASEPLASLIKRALSAPDRPVNGCCRNGGSTACVELLQLDAAGHLVPCAGHAKPNASAKGLPPEGLPSIGSQTNGMRSLTGPTNGSTVNGAHAPAETTNGVSTHLAGESNGTRQSQLSELETILPEESVTHGRPVS